MHTSRYLLAGAMLLLASFPSAGIDDVAVKDSADALTARPMLLGAHRCGRGEWPENTLRAVTETANRWPDALLEVDAQISADGHVVLIHDFGVDRTTNGTGYVGAKTLEELRALDAAWHFSPDGGKTYPYRGAGIVIPTLDEALAAAPNHRFMIEMKDGAGIGKAVAEVIRRAGASDRCILASISPLYLEEFRAHAPEVATSFDFLSAADMLAALRGGPWESYKPAHRVLVLSPELRERFALTPDEFSRMREKGILISMFTLNKPEEMRQAIDWGVDSILTDRPSVLAGLLEEGQEKE